MELNDSKKDDFFINPPRTGVLKKYFDEMILEKKNVPLNYYFDIHTLFKGSPELLSLADVYQKYESAFDKHARSSIPFSYEETIRLYSTIFNYLVKHRSGGNIIEIDAANGSVARSVTEMSRGRIKSLCTTPNKSNVEIFNNNHPDGSYIFEGASKDVVTFLKENHLIADVFNNGFDVFFEAVGFQMYGSERKLPIRYFKQLLKKDGIMVCFEKNSQADLNEYEKREIQKNEIFKTRYFTTANIKEKKREILSIMDKNLVTLEYLEESLCDNFDNVVHIWNSGNFNIVIASDSEISLKKFLKIMPKTIIEKDFVYCKVPRVVKGNVDLSI